FRRALPSLEGEPVPARFGQLTPPSVSSRAFLALCLAEIGAFAEGIIVAEEAVRIAETIEHPYSIVAALLGPGFLSRRKGDFHHAIAVLQRTLALCQEANILVFVPITAATLGAVYALTKRTAEVLPLLGLVKEHTATGNFMAFHALVL